MCDELMVKNVRDMNHYLWVGVRWMMSIYSMMRIYICGGLRVFGIFVNGEFGMLRNYISMVVKMWSSCFYNVYFFINFVYQRMSERVLWGCIRLLVNGVV